jgi:hypothetical protein
MFTGNPWEKLPQLCFKQAGSKSLVISGKPTLALLLHQACFAYLGNKSKIGYAFKLACVRHFQKLDPTPS